MKKVKPTKYPSLIQMSNMAFNLREKYNKYCSIERVEEVNAHVNDSEVTTTIKFKFYIEPTFHYCSSWYDLLLKYQELISAEVPSD